MTKEIEQLRELMLDWTEGRRSNWNEFAGHADESLSAARAACAVADAQEVVKLSAAIQALCAIASLRAPIAIVTDERGVNHNLPPVLGNCCQAGRESYPNPCKWHPNG